MSSGSQHYVQWYLHMSQEIQQALSRTSSSINDNDDEDQKKNQILTEQLEIIECMYYDRLYTVDDYSSAFREGFHIRTSQARCKQLVLDVLSGSTSILFDNWQHTCDSYLSSFDRR